MVAAEWVEALQPWIGQPKVERAPVARTRTRTQTRTLTLTLALTLSLTLTLTRRVRSPCSRRHM